MREEVRFGATCCVVDGDLRRAGELDMMIGNVAGVYRRIESHRFVEI